MFVPKLFHTDALWEAGWSPAQSVLLRAVEDYVATPSIQHFYITHVRVLPFCVCVMCLHYRKNNNVIVIKLLHCYFFPREYFNKVLSKLVNFISN